MLGHNCRRTTEGWQSPTRRAARGLRDSTPTRSLRQGLGHGRASVSACRGVRAAAPGLLVLQKHPGRPLTQNSSGAALGPGGGPEPGPGPRFFHGLSGTSGVGWWQEHVVWNPIRMNPRSHFSHVRGRDTRKVT
ncbi:hypothetical protein HJG60_008542 [Phyllostomus discolor]|uniref:Uncharacterized protein n=1 Tax=Phyllostomus discolor TaxID=89673 RepID=A0A833Z168_9CHIR|nr:hypothetical protein HJG60_008542 [Phyllostomus discolor]